MITESQQQIAREAAEKCVKIANDAMCHHCLTTSLNTVGDFLPDILSAIERATGDEDLMYRYHNDGRFHAFVQRLQAETLNQYKDHISQPQRSEQQEWTDHALNELVMDLRVATGNFADIHKSFLEILKPWFDKHDAELATERQRADDAVGAYKAEIKSHQRTNDLLTAERKQLRECDEVLFDGKPKGYEPNRTEAVRQIVQNLTIERQRREQAEQLIADRNREPTLRFVKSEAENKQLREQLLSALAAIENVLQYTRRNDEIGGCICTTTILRLLGSQCDELARVKEDN